MSRNSGMSSDLDDIEKLIADFQQGSMRELHVRAGGVEIYLSNDPAASGLDAGPAPLTQVLPAAAPPSAAKPVSSPVAPAAVAAPPAMSADIPEGGVVVHAPYLGAFYRAPKPGEPAYVEIGGRVAPDSELCLIEVMKLFTTVRAGVAGTVHSILVQDGQMVEAEQPLFIIVPA